MNKIDREIAILKRVHHPNIVKLCDVLYTDRHIGIILEYASGTQYRMDLWFTILGGELFDYILSHRYLKDHVACKLFAQLISGVSYLHEKGIVHRDLKLVCPLPTFVPILILQENLLLDQNRNVIITDFGFANTFNVEELGEDNDNIIAPPDNRRIGDLMQTSCGSPCYAAPELVVTDGLYAGRKVDVWSCGVILVSPWPPL
jgi:protein-serine/threonine kinase